MPRVIGIDPGTVSIDLCGLEDGRVFLDESFPTSESRTFRVLEVLAAAGPLDLIAGPSGYGLPLTAVQDLTSRDLRLAFLAAEGEAGGISGLGSFIRALGQLSTPVVLTPGVVHLVSVPAHRKVNRVDMGTADKVCAAALGIYDQSRLRQCPLTEVAFILLELGGAFTAAVAVQGGRIVDGLGGTSGPIGMRAAGALDGEVAFLAGSVPKSLLFDGGASRVAGTPDASPEAIATPDTPQARLAWEAYLEGAVKAVATLAVAAPNVFEVQLSGRMALVDGVPEELAKRLDRVLPGVRVRTLKGFATSKQAAQGAALIADGLAGGAAAGLVEQLGIREARGTVLDHLFVIPPAAARACLGID